MEKKSPPARQQRSRDTEERLLNAALSLLETGGLDGAVIPRIAELAQVAPASVYRRFADKSALLRAAFLTMLRNSHEASRVQAPQLILRAGLAESLCQVARQFMLQYRGHPQLLRALVRFMESDTEAGFIAEARAIMRQNTSLMVDLLMEHRAEVRHVPKRAALHFAISGMACAIESFALEQESLWHAEAAMTDQEMVARVAHGAFAYLVTPFQ
jgi:AcrR family transcriptional regulator